MANKASKSLARANTATLNRAHITTLALHLLFILYRLLFRQGSWTKYFLLSIPSLLIEFYLEKLGRPNYNRPGGDLRSPGEDLAAKGVTEYAWDIIYVTWICLGLVMVFGDWAWWLALVVPAYAGFLAVTLYQDYRGGKLPGMPAIPTAAAGEGGVGLTSKRQAKMEHRGGQKVRNR